MKRRPLGKTGRSVGEVGFGAWAIGGAAYGDGYGATDDRVSCGAVLRALELGCDFFDTADLYGRGRSEALLGICLQRVPREQVVVATKAGYVFDGAPPAGALTQDFSLDYLRRQLRASLARLRLGEVDVFFAHNPPEAVIRSGLLDTLRTLQREGLTRWVGVSLHSPAEARAALEAGPPDVLQVVHNFAQQDHAKAGILDRCSALGVGVVAREPLSNGFLSGKYAPGARFGAGDIRVHWHPDFVRRLAGEAARLRAHVREGACRTPAQAALRFVLDDPRVSVTIAGMKTAAQVDENVAASALPMLDWSVD